MWRYCLLNQVAHTVITRYESIKISKDGVTQLDMDLLSKHARTLINYHLQLTSHMTKFLKIKS